jgi:hypothetical protein
MFKPASGFEIPRRLRLHAAEHNVTSNGQGRTVTRIWMGHLVSHARGGTEAGGGGGSV